MKTPATGSRPTQRKSRSRAAIIQATQQVLAREGFAATTVELILVEAKVARATFYVHFADKRAAARAVVGEMWRRSEELYLAFAALPAADAGSVRAWLWFVHRRWSEHYQETLTLIHDLPEEVAIDVGDHLDRFVDQMVGDGRHWQCSVDKARCRAHLLIVQVERAMMDLFRGIWTAEPELVIDELTTIWCATLRQP